MSNFEKGGSVGKWFSSPSLTRQGFNLLCLLSDMGEGRLGLPLPFSPCSQTSRPSGK